MKKYYSDGRFSKTSNVRFRMGKVLFVLLFLISLSNCQNSDNPVVINEYKDLVENVNKKVVIEGKALDSKTKGIDTDFAFIYFKGEGHWKKSMIGRKIVVIGKLYKVTQPIDDNPHSQGTGNEFEFYINVESIIPVS